MEEKKLQLLQSVLAENLLAVYSYNPPFNQLINVFILKKIDYTQLNNLKFDIAKTPFIILQENDLLAGNDVFALDLLHLKTNSQLIWGEDYFPKLDISAENIRLKLEFEIRNKLIYLREQFLLNRKAIDLLKLILPTTDMFITAIFFLMSKTRHNDFEQDINTIEKKYSLSLEVFKKLYQFHLNQCKISDKEAVEYVQMVNDQLVKLLFKIQ